MTLVRAESLTRVFGRGKAALRAVDDVSFALDAGEIVSLVGPSGSGKTTLSRLVLRLLAPTAGRLTVAGRDVTHLRAGQLRGYWRDVQAVFQDPFSAANQFLTVRRVLARTRLLLDGVTNDELDARMTSVLHAVGLSRAILGLYPHQLSGGQRQRVMLARALMSKPKLIVADEATSMLDASLRASILNLLLDLRTQTGLSVLFVTHDMGQAYYLSDRVLVMSKGRLVESGPTDDVMFRPRHPDTRRLLTDVPVLRAAPQVGHRSAHIRSAFPDDE